MVFHFVFFFKQKTAYEMRISDWSSDVCSSDLPGGAAAAAGEDAAFGQLSRAVLADEMKKMEQGAVGIVLGDECAAALAADDEILRRQIVQRLADGALADPEFMRELHFARQRAAGLPDAFDRALEYGSATGRERVCT